jgi:hypothetical protein
LALRRWYLPTKRSSQPPHLGFAAFGHLFLPNQMAQANHGSGGGNNKQFPPLSLQKIPIQIVMEAVLDLLVKKEED